jgi:hypothetical protein
MSFKKIGTVQGITWVFNPSSGEISGYEGDGSVKTHSFFCGNPPDHKSDEWELFFAVCELAVNLKLMRRIATYTSLESE